MIENDARKIGALVNAVVVGLLIKSSAIFAMRLVRVMLGRVKFSEV